MYPNFTIDFLLNKLDQVEDTPTMLSEPKSPPLPLFISPMYPDENTNGTSLVPMPLFDMRNSMFGMNQLPQINPFSQHSVNLPLFMNLQNMPFMTPQVRSQNNSAQVSASLSDVLSKPRNSTKACLSEVELPSHQRYDASSKSPSLQQQQLCDSETAVVEQVDEDIPGRCMTKRQREMLESEFPKTPFPSKKDRERLSNQTGLSAERIKTWFTHKRFAVRKVMKAQSSPPTVDVLAWKNRFLKFSISQRKALTEEFRKCVDLGKEELAQLVASTGLTALQIRHWFTNQLHELKQKKKQANPSLTTREIWKLLEEDGFISVKNRQTEIMLDAFEIKQKLTASEIARLAKQTGRTEKAIKSWFAHRRRNLKKKNAEGQHQETPTDD